MAETNGRPSAERSQRADMNPSDSARREREHLHRQAIDLADRLDAFAEGIGHWVTTASLVRQAASSLRWQVRWDERRPQDCNCAPGLHCQEIER